ncbi:MULTISPECIES: glycosyltransferase [unclassified Adlercreutzia]|uniref:glycosyltransferase n=1 Tax=unclassified Adlercreutzia TaxID=2636013 RepID=UPI0013EB2A78|nr:MULTISPECIES: glycosyltransferase [unclassified Adlercreutzia]
MASGCKPRVLLAHNFYQVPGGEDAVFSNEGRLLREEGHGVVEYTRHNDEVRGLAGRLELARSLRWSRRTYEEVRSLIRRESVDLVHCHNAFPLISPSIYDAARDEGVPVVQTVHNFRLLCPGATFYRDGEVCEECLSGGLGRAVRHGCYKGSRVYTEALARAMEWHRAHRVYRGVHMVFLTEFNKTKHLKFVREQGCVAHVKPNFSFPVNLSESRRSNGRKLLFVGRLEEEKGIKLLLDFWKAQDSKCSYELVILGSGSLERAVADCQSFCSNVSFLGRLEHGCVLEQIANSEALIFPSLWYEGFPMTIAESFSLGVPVISSDLGNHGQIVRESGGGACFSVSSSDSFWSCVDRVCSRREEYAYRARKYFETNLSKQSNLKMLDEIYNMIASSRKGEYL